LEPRKRHDVHVAVACGCVSFFGVKLQFDAFKMGGIPWFRRMQSYYVDV